MTSKTVSIVIPTVLSQPEYLIDCLESVYKSTYDHSAFEIILVINGNQSAWKTLKPRIPRDPSVHIKVICLPKNMGFPYAVNTGMFSSDSSYIALLNDDVEVNPEWLSELIKEQEKSKADMVASTIYLHKDKTIDSLGFTFLWRGKAIPNRELRPNLSSDSWFFFPSFFPLNEPGFFHEPFGADAAACLFTRRVVDALEGFDTRFFAYLEDVDFAFRARRQGYRCALAQKAVAFHHKHSSSSKMKWRKSYLDMLNWWKIILFRYSPAVWASYLGVVILERLRNTSGLLKAFLRSTFYPRT
jgi:GT2 family glycosyltransferase